MNIARMGGNEERRSRLFDYLMGANAAVAATLLIWSLSSESDRYEREAADRSYHYARNAEGKITANCRPRISADPVKCIEEAKQAAREYQREEQDLAAQKVTAWWTKIMGAAALLGVLLSVFGVFLVYRTFRAQREANEIARETAKNELRAYVAVEARAVRLHYRTGDGGAHIGIINNGQTPALDLSHCGSIFVATMEKAERDLKVTTGKNAIGRAAPIALHAGQDIDASLGILEPLKPEDLRAAADPDSDKFLFVFGNVFYKDVFGAEHETRFCYVAEDLPAPPKTGNKETPGGRWTLAPFYNEFT